MMKRFTILAMLTVFTAVFSAEATAQTAKCDEACMVDRALAGDPIAAGTLSSSYIKEPKIRDYWTLIAAENGNRIYQYNLGILYVEYPKNSLENRRGFFWMCEASRGGYEEAKKYLNERNHDCR